MQLFSQLREEEVLGLIELPFVILYGMCDSTPKERVLTDINVVRALEYGFDPDDRSTDHYKSIVRCNAHKIYHHFTSNSTKMDESELLTTVATPLAELENGEVPCTEKISIYHMLHYYAKKVSEGVFLKSSEQEAAPYQELLSKCRKRYSAVEQLLLVNTRDYFVEL